jgi:uncharacterized alpha-E superfamily protein
MHEVIRAGEEFKLEAIMLLSRTADSMFWMARYIERAECIARLLDVGRRMSSLLPDPANASSEWTSTIEAAGCEETFAEAFGVATAANVIEHLVRDPRNPSSIFTCLATVRQNARAVRTALSQDVWNAVNGMWIESQGWGDEDFTVEGLPRVLDWVKERSQWFGGAFTNTMLRSDAYWWARLGTFLERAENSARIVDVKYHVLLPRGQSDVGSHLDYYQWGAILGAVSAFRAYHWVYRDSLKPLRVAELMILRRELPRSLLSCASQVTHYLTRIASAGSGDVLAHEDGDEDSGSTDARGEASGAVTGGFAIGPDVRIAAPTPANALAGSPSLTAAQSIELTLRSTTIEEIFANGLHEFLTTFIESMNALGTDVRREYCLG